jgi:phage terminase Nu1 subunit (DNA packaging protein)
MPRKPSENTPTRHVTRAGLAEIFGKSMPTIDSWVRAGCPFVKRGGRGVEWTFDTAAVAAWLHERAVADATGTTVADEAELKRRKLSAETAVAELDLAKAKGLVAPLDQIERNLARVFAEVRANLRNIPGAVVSVLIGETDERQFKQVLLQEIDQALEALADADLTAEDDDDADDEDDAE